MFHLFLVNPAAGRHDSTAAITAAAESLSQALGEPYEIKISAKKGDITRFADEAGRSRSETRIYACGGDGTLNEAVTGAYGYPNLSLTSIPCGSGNDYIKHFSNPKRFYDLANFREVETRNVDLMAVNDRRCIGICSAGLDARIGTSVDAFRRFPLLSGSRAYKASIVVNLLKGIAKPCRIELASGEVIDRDLTLCCVCNASWYGGGYQPVPEADITDGILDILVVKKVSLFVVAKVISAYQKGQYAAFPSIITHYRTNALRIVTPEEEPVNLDGELLRTKETTIRVLPRSLRFFAPKGAW